VCGREDTRVPPSIQRKERASSPSRRLRRGSLREPLITRSARESRGKVRGAPPCLRGAPLTRTPCGGRCARPICCASNLARTRLRRQRHDSVPTTGRRDGNARNPRGKHSRCWCHDGQRAVLPRRGAAEADCRMSAPHAGQCRRSEGRSSWTHALMVQLHARRNEGESANGPANSKDQSEPSSNVRGSIGLSLTSFVQSQYGLAKPRYAKPFVLRRRGKGEG
jgi:hypothetical protein